VRCAVSPVLLSLVIGESPPEYWMHKPTQEFARSQDIVLMDWITMRD